jgi:glutaredoxin-related protein
MKKIVIFLLFLIIGLGFVFFKPIFAQEAKGNAQLFFFYSKTCPHCTAEEKFLDKMEIKYPDLEILRYLNTDQSKQELLKSLLEKSGAERYLGLVPLTFVQDEFFLGFDNDQGVGGKIELAIKSAISNSTTTTPPINKDKVNLPILGNIDTAKYSIPALAIVLGFLDGFNVCSLGALVFILGLVLAFRSRKKTLIFGSIFLLTTAIVYGALMGVWYQLFSLLSSYMFLMQITVVIICFVGAWYFFKQFFKFKKQGVTCEANENKTVNKLTQKLGHTFNNSTNILLIASSVLIFAGLVTIIEFPCSAAVPLVFAGVLAQADIGGLQHFLYIAIYLIMYLLDEVIVFLVAFFTMRLWLSSGKATKIITLIEGIILLILGGYYLISLIA